MFWIPMIPFLIQSWSLRCTALHWLASPGIPGRIVAARQMIAGNWQNAALLAATDSELKLTFGVAINQHDCICNSKWRSRRKSWQHRSRFIFSKAKKISLASHQSLLKRPIFHPEKKAGLSKNHCQEKNSIIPLSKQICLSQETPRNHERTGSFGFASTANVVRKGHDSGGHVSREWRVHCNKAQLTVQKTCLLCLWQTHLSHNNSPLDLVEIIAGGYRSGRLQCRHQVSPSVGHAGEGSSLLVR